MTIVNAFKDSAMIYFKNFILVFISGIVALLLSPLVAPVIGFQMIFVRIKRGERASFKDLFLPFRNFPSLFCSMIWFYLITVLLTTPSYFLSYLRIFLPSQILLIVCLMALLYLFALWMFTQLLIFDKDTSIETATKLSWERVTRNNSGMHVLLLIAGILVSGVGAFLYGYGIVLTLPLGLGAIACAYADETK